MGLQKYLEKITYDLRRGIVMPKKELQAPTRKYFGKQEATTGTSHPVHAEEAVIYAWHEKNLANPKKFSPGHAALKLTRFDTERGRNALVDFVSWGPGYTEAEAPEIPSKTEKTKAGYTTDPKYHASILDRRQQMARDKDLRLVLKMQFIRQANSENNTQKKEFTDYAKGVWDDLAKERQDTLKKKHKVGEGFTSLARSPVQVQNNQIVLSAFVGKARKDHGQHYHINSRLDTLIKEPSSLNQGDIGTCGFTATLMALCKIEGADKVLSELIDAIWHKNKFRGMTVYKGGKPAEPGAVRQRLLKRLRHIPPHILRVQSHLVLDYFLNVGLMIFFTSHVKTRSPKIFKMLLPGVTRDDDDIPPGKEPHFVLNSTNLKEVASGTKQLRWFERFSKRGDFPMSPRAVLELLKLCGAERRYRLKEATRPVKGGQQPQWERHPDYPFMERIDKNLTQLVKDSLAILCCVGDANDFLALCAEEGWVKDDPLSLRQALTKVLKEHPLWSGQQKSVGDDLAWLTEVSGGEHWVMRDPGMGPKDEVYWTWGLKVNLYQMRTVLFEKSKGEVEQIEKKRKPWASMVSMPWNYKELRNIYILPGKRQMRESRTAREDYLRIKNQNLTIDYLPKAKMSKNDLRLNHYAPKLRGGLHNMIEVGKMPFAKVYVSCSCPPAPYITKDITHANRRTSWGLSIDAMGHASRPYHERLRGYAMQSMSLSCAGAVNTILKAGLGDIITDMVPKRAKLLPRWFVVPSDLIQVGKRMTKNIWTMDKQQSFLDLKAYEQRASATQLALEDQCLVHGWRRFFSKHTDWRALSEGRGARCAKKRKIDTLMYAFAKAEKSLAGSQSTSPKKQRGKNGYSWEMEVGYLWRLEAIWQALEHKNKRVRELEEKKTEHAGLQNKQDHQAEKARKRLERQMFLLKKSIDSLEYDFKLYDEELARYEKIRRGRAAKLIKLHKAIFAYVKAYKKKSEYAANDQRYLAVLLLGQFVSWRYAEVTHDNLSVELIQGGWARDIFVLKGLFLNLAEKDPKLSEHYRRYTA